MYGYSRLYRLLEEDKVPGQWVYILSSRRKEALALPRERDDVRGGFGRDIARPTTSVEKLCYIVPETGALLKFSRNHSYELARSGEITVINLEIVWLFQSQISQNV